MNRHSLMKKSRRRSEQEEKHEQFYNFSDLHRSRLSGQLRKARNGQALKICFCGSDHDGAERCWQNGGGLHGPIDEGVKKGLVNFKIAE